MKRNVYTLTGSKTLSTVANALEHYLADYQKMECQTLTASDGTLVVQGRSRHDGAKQFVGLNKAITVKLQPMEGRAFTVEIGKGEWLKKSLVMAVSMVVLWPLFITSGVGIDQRYDSKQRDQHCTWSFRSLRQPDQRHDPRQRNQHWA